MRVYDCSRPTARATDCSHLRAQQYFHTQAGFPTTTSQVGTSWSLLQAGAEPCPCTEHLPWEAASVTPRGDPRVPDLNLDLWNHGQAPLWATRGETTRGTNSASSIVANARGGFPPLPPPPAAHSSIAAVLCHFSCTAFHKWGHTLWWSWIQLTEHMVPSQMTQNWVGFGADDPSWGWERKPSWCGMQGVPSPREKRFLTQNYKLEDFKAVGFMHGKPVTGAGLEPAYLGLSHGVIWQGP